MFKLPCVLLVDDDDTTNYLNQLLFNRLGVAETLLVALNGQDALNQLQVCDTPQGPPFPSLILLDMKMPVMDGFEFLEAYVQLPAAQRESVLIMLTTSLNPQDVVRMQDLPITGFLTKPLTKDKIYEVLHTHFGHPLPE
ncbi:response regulator [Hymenobacter chitinivorans]|uniref:Response regulator receiver domain-containing protein n=1 Tax=Hymenobacter chitinivorans DSM 11115 TaxID=1121954 RepID=A0A2M9BSC5_9BACT|nr:response regulator [Hymenobacter chitinivorans]PJJ60859.1 response regulator receiver domain-containing protein [Hymenobacter chitinivorans DSM 11115]